VGSLFIGLVAAAAKTDGPVVWVIAVLVLVVGSVVVLLASGVLGSRRLEVGSDAVRLLRGRDQVVGQVPFANLVEARIGWRDLNTKSEREVLEITLIDRRDQDTWWPKLDQRRRRKSWWRKWLPRRRHDIVLENRYGVSLQRLRDVITTGFGRYWTDRSRPDR
jgi:hypothetical protein